MGIYEFANYLTGCSWFAGGAILPLPVFGVGMAAGAVVLPKRPVVWSKKVRVHGHPILGFFSGLIAGLGAVVLAWQYAVWTLHIWNGIGIPVLLGLLGAVWAWIGKGYRIQVRAGGSSPSAETPAEPPTATPATEASSAPDAEPTPDSEPTPSDLPAAPLCQEGHVPPGGTNRLPQDEDPPLLPP